MKEITKDWIKSAIDDLKIIRKIIDDETLAHQIAFHAQQAIEKSLKAIVEEYEIDFMRTHSLETLLSKTKEYLITLSINIDIIKKLDQLYIDARYPGDLGLLPDGKPGIQEAQIFQETAEKIHNYISEHLYNK
ncbi:hypothetical protein ES708_23813 [subsurface metagenome]